jgi:hypothetical protein
MQIVIKQHSWSYNNKATLLLINRLLLSCILFYISYLLFEVDISNVITETQRGVVYDGYPHSNAQHVLNLNILCYTSYIKNLHCSPLHTLWQLPSALVIWVYHLIVHWNSAVSYVGSQLHSLFLKTEILVMQWLFQLWEEFEIRTDIRTATRVRHYLPLVIGENILYNLCDMSCIVMEKTVTFLFNTSVRTWWKNDSGIPDSIVISSHVIGLSSSKMVGIIAASVSPVYVLSLSEHSWSLILSRPWWILWDLCEIWQQSNFESPHPSRNNSQISVAIQPLKVTVVLIFDPVL